MIELGFDLIDIIDIIIYITEYKLIDNHHSQMGKDFRKALMCCIQAVSGTTRYKIDPV